MPICRQRRMLFCVLLMSAAVLLPRSLLNTFASSTTEASTGTSITTYAPAALAPHPLPLDQSKTPPAVTLPAPALTPTPTPTPTPMPALPNERSEPTSPNETTARALEPSAQRVISELELLAKGELHHAQEVLETAWRSQQLTGAGNRSVAASYVRHFYPELTDIQALDQPRSNAAGLQMKIVIDGTAVNWPPVTVITPTCYDRQSRHANLLQMWQHQDYPGPLELLVLDGPCYKMVHHCARNNVGKSETLSEANSAEPFRHPDGEYSHRTVRYLESDTLMGNSALGAKRNWLVKEAGGDVIAHFDDDDYYAPHYLSTMVYQLRTGSAKLVKLTSWLTYGEKFETHPWKRIPIMEWERQDGLGWGFSYVYERSYALEHPFTAHLDASEEAGFVDVFKKQKQHRVAVGAPKYIGIADGNLLVLRIASWSCIRTTGSIPVDRCNREDIECEVLPEWLAFALYGKRIAPFLASWHNRY